MAGVISSGLATQEEINSWGQVYIGNVHIVGGKPDDKVTGWDRFKLSQSMQYESFEDEELSFEERLQEMSDEQLNTLMRLSIRLNNVGRLRAIKFEIYERIVRKIGYKTAKEWKKPYHWGL